MYSRVYTCTGGSVRHPYIWYMDGIHCTHMYRGEAYTYVWVTSVTSWGGGEGDGRGWVVTKMPT